MDPAMDLDNKERIAAMLQAAQDFEKLFPDIPEDLSGLFEGWLGTEILAAMTVVTCGMKAASGASSEVGDATLGDAIMVTFTAMLAIAGRKYRELEQEFDKVG